MSVFSFQSTTSHHNWNAILFSGNFPHETWEKNFCDKSSFPAFSSSFRTDGISFSNSSSALLDSLFEGTSEDVNVPVYLNVFKPELSWQSEMSNTLNSSIKLFMTFMPWSQLLKSCFLDEGGVWHLDGDTFLNGVDVRSDGDALIFLCKRWVFLGTCIAEFVFSVWCFLFLRKIKPSFTFSFK